LLDCISFDLRFAHLPGGGYAYVTQLLPALLELCPHIRWRLYYNPASAAQQSILQRLRGDGHRGPTDGPPQRHGPEIELRPVRSNCLSLRQHLEFRRFRDDASLYHYPHFDMPLGMRNIPLVITIHDLYPLIVPGYCSRLKRTYFHYVAGYNARRARRIIAVSRHTRNDIVRHLGIPEDKITVIPLSYSSACRPLCGDECLERVRRQYSLPTRFIFYAGNHKPHKNLDRLIQGYGRLRSDLRSEFPLLLTGRVGPDSRPLLARTAQLGLEESVRFLDWVSEDDLPALYNLASLVMLPSLYEGFGIPPLEALACGTAVACSNAAAIPEVVGNQARLFEPTCVDSIADALTKALENDLDNPELAAARIAHTAAFSIHKSARSMLDVYESVGR